MSHNTAAAAPRPAISRRLPEDSVHRIIPGLDGLRALAVLAVFIYHIDPNLLPGGFLGVDVFFVISGFLITTLLVREHWTNGGIKLGAFWIRRARRLLPALLLVVAVCLPAAWLAGWLVRGNDLLVGTGRQTLGALTFSTNWLEIHHGASYFAQGAPILFVNFWSLAVEEQFYLVWPLAVAGLLAWSRRRGSAGNAALRSAACLALAALSAGWMALLAVPGQDPTRVYYGTDTHVFGLMLGAALAFAFAHPAGLPTGRSPLTHGLWARLRVPVAFVALALLLAGMFLVHHTAPWTYPWGLLGASATTLAVVSALPGRPNALNRMFSLRPLAWVGERSYGIYLWHWPALLVCRAVFPPASGPGDLWFWAGSAVAVVVAFLLSALSFTYLETPVRKLGFRGFLRRVLPGGGLAPAARAGFAGMLALGTAAAVAVPFVLAAAPGKTQAQRLIEEGQRAAAAARTIPPAPHSQPSMPPPSPAPAAEQPAPVPAPQAPALAGDQLTIIGDSVAASAAPALLDAFPGADIDAEVGRSWVQGLETIRRRAQEGTLRPVVAVVLGANGRPTGDELDQIVQAAGVRKLVFATSHGDRPWIPASNAELQELRKRRPAVGVGDFDRLVQGRPELFATDGIHPGYEAGLLLGQALSEGYASALKQ